MQNQMILLTKQLQLKKWDNTDDTLYSLHFNIHDIESEHSTYEFFSDEDRVVY